MSDRLSSGIVAGSTSNILYIMLRKTSDGTGQTGKVYTDVTGSYVRNGGSRTSITMATQTVTGAFSSGGFVEVDSTNLPGLYRFDPPDASVATGGDSVVYGLLVTGCFLEPFMYGLTTGENVRAFGGTAVTGRDIGLSVLLSSGTGTGQLSLTSGAVLLQATQSGVTIPTVTTVTNLTNAPGAGDFTATMKTSLNAATPASVAGAVGSVTGAVGSVTGNVGGNVVGSVGSISGITFPTNFPLLSIDGSGLVNIIQAGADKVWITTARLLTAGTNIVLAKGVGVTGFNDIAATAIVSSGAITTSSGKVAEVVLVDTLTTYTGNTPQTGDSYARIGASGAGLTALAQASSWTSTFATQLSATLVSSGVFSTAALANAPSGGGGGAPTVQQIDAQLSGTHGAGAWGGASGSGANAVTVTVTDGTSPLSNVAVRLTNGINNFTATTNNSGVASFSLDAAIYTRSMTRGGYQFTPDSITVSVSGNFNAAMNAIVIPAPSNPTTCAVYGFLVLPNGKPAANVPVTFTLFSPAAKSSGMIATRVITATTDSTGQIASVDGEYVALLRNDMIDPAGSSWTMTCSAVAINAQVTLASSTYNIATLIP